MRNVRIVVVILLATLSASAAPNEPKAAVAQKVTPVAPNAVRALKVLPELRVQQLKAGTLRNEAIKAAVDRIRTGQAAAIPAELSRVTAATINDGAVVKCGDKVKLKIHLVGGTRSSGLHQITVARLQNLEQVGFIPAMEQKGAEVTLGANEERDVVVEPDWTVRCARAGLTLNLADVPEPFIVALQAPSNTAARPPVTPELQVLAVFPFGKFAYASQNVQGLAVGGD